MEEKGKKTEEIIRKEAGKTSSTAGGLTPEEKANMQRMMKHLPQAPSRPDPEEDPPPRRAILKENRHGMAPDGGDEDDVETVEMKMKMIVETVEMEVKKIVATEDKGGEKGAEGGKKGKYHPHRTQWTEAEVVEWLGNTPRYSPPIKLWRIFSPFSYAVNSNGDDLLAIQGNRRLRRARSMGRMTGMAP